MKPPIRSRAALQALFLGLFIFSGLIVWQGAAPLLQAFSKGGANVLLLPLPFLFALTLMTHAWRVLFPGPHRPPFLRLYFLNWIGTAINWLLPVAQMGGEVIKAMWLGRTASVPGHICGSSVIVEKTVQAMVQALVALLGVVLLAGNAGSMDLIATALIFTLVLSTGVYVFYRVQRQGLFGKIAGWSMFGASPMRQWADDAGRMDETIQTIYRNRKALLESLTWRLASRLFLAAEIWLALELLGYPVDWAGALLLECLGQTIRAAAFFVPGAFGVQEGGYMVLGLVAGLPLDISLTLSLVKRVRELMVGLPALLVWQTMETRSLAQRRPYT